MADHDEHIIARLDALQASLDVTVPAQLPPAFRHILGTLIASHQEIVGVLQTTRKEIRSLAQTAALARRQIPIPPSRPIRCLFLVHGAEYWDAWRTIYEAMRADSDFEPIIATTQSMVKLDRVVTAKGETAAHEMLENIGLPHLRFSMADSYEALDIIKAMAPDVIFRQVPWEGAMPPAFYTDEISFARLCYVPYGFGVVKKLMAKDDETSRDDLTDQHLHRMCWRVFCETETHRAAFLRRSARQGDNVVVSGYPKFDTLLAARDRGAPWPVTETGGKRSFRLIWAPHHSLTPEWLGFGTFHKVYRDMLAWARERPDISFVMKPHPILFGLAVDKKVMTQAEIDDFLSVWRGLPNTAIVEGGDFGPLFAASDAMLTDGISFFAEYQIFEKPLLFLDSGTHIDFNETGLIVIESANRVTNIAEARALCERLQAGEPDPRREIQKKMLGRIMPFPGQSARKIMDSIREGIAKESGY